ncbi:MAG: thiamine pyrophosphate-binding protein [Pseudomonadota bacterium]
MEKTSAATVLVDALIANGISHVFCVPGESYLPVLDALHEARDQISLITCRHETAAANMAEAYGKLTGKPGVCMVTRGPGATQAAVGVHTAFQDSTPMILIVGQVARDMADREAFQEIEYRSFFAPISKWAAQIDSAPRMAEYMHRAFATAQSGRRGPVVLAAPEDMLTDQVDPVVQPRVLPAAPAPSSAAIETFSDMLSASEQPLLLAGGGGWTSEAVNDLRAFVEATGLPIALTFRSKDLFDNLHPQFAGDVGIGPNPLLADRIKSSDLIIALGPRLGEMTSSGYSLLIPGAPTTQKLVHIHPGAEELGRVFWPALSIHSSPGAFLKAALGTDLRLNRCHLEQANSAHDDVNEFSEQVDVASGVNLSAVFRHLGETLPDDAIVCNGAGNYAAWLHRFYRHRSYKTQLAPTSGAMGYGFPAALAAKAYHPNREVFCIAGDGCFMMASNELATAKQYGLNVVSIVVNNSALGTIRMHQEGHFPGRVAGTDLANPDFVAYAESFGAFGVRVETSGEFPSALSEARNAGMPAVIELVTSVEEIAPGKRLNLVNG